MDGHALNLLYIVTGIDYARDMRSHTSRIAVPRNFSSNHKLTAGQNS